MTDTTTTDTTPTEPTEPMTLTAEDITAMRAATSWAVRLDGGIATLRLTKRLPERTRDGFTARTSSEPERTITGTAPTIVKAWFSEAYLEGNFAALRQLVRAGDQLRWYADQGAENSYLRAAVIPPGALQDSHYHAGGYDRLYCDSLCVDVVRKGKRIIERMTITFSLCPQNSARAYEGSGQRARRAEYTLTAGAGE
jgi:hypothetical protein